MFKIGYGIDYTNQPITIKYQGKEFLLNLEKNGKISGDRNIFCTIENYSCETDYNKFDKWKKINENTIQLTNIKGNRYFKIFFFKDKMLIFYDGLADFANKKLLEYESNFKNSLNDIKLSDFYNDRQLAFLKSKLYIRYIKSESGLPLYTEPSAKSKVIETMNRGEKFYITQFSVKNEMINDIKGQWVQGYWRCIKGWAFDGFMQDKTLRYENRNIKELYKNVKRGYITYPKTKIYEIPDNNSRVISDFTWNDSVLVLKSEKVQPGWLYIDTQNFQNLAGDEELIVGCIEEKNICYEEQFQKLNEFNPVTIEGCFGDACVKYTFKKDA